MIKLMLVAAVAAAWIASPAFAYSVAVHHSNTIALDSSRLYDDDPPLNQCEQARQLGWPHTSCVYD